MRIVALLVAAGLAGLTGCGDADDLEPAAGPATVTSDPAPSSSTDTSTTTTTASTTTSTTAAPTTTAAPATTSTTVAADAGPRACSAEGMDPVLQPRPDLPAAVQATRQALADAAVACDYDALAALASTGTQGFTYSFGDGGDPAGFWRAAEASGGEELRLLVALLDQPSGRQEVDGAMVIHAWPSAFTYEFWNEVPADQRAALRPLYDPEEFEFFEKFGAYLGYRVGIDDGGEWIFFVAGD